MKATIGIHKFMTGMLTASLTLMVLLAAPIVGQAADDTTTVTLTLESGGLMLEEAPHMNFGTNTIDSSAMAFDSVDTDDYIIHVKDLRGNGGGWSLAVKLNTFGCPSVASDSLPGASISVANASVVSDDSTNPATLVGSAISLTAGDAAQRILYAEAGKGLYNNTCTWTITGVNLNVLPNPALMSETHTSTLVWTLTDGPGA